MLEKKLNAGEIQRVVEKIKKKYDEYTYRYLKSPKLKFAFEERYKKAHKIGMDISNFLAAEISAIEELIKKEETRQSGYQKTLTPANTKENPSQNTPKKDFADKIIDELNAKIAKYDDISIHADASYEIRRLLGSLHKLYETYSPLLQSLFKKTALTTTQVMDIEARLRSMGSIDRDNVAPRLTRYYALLNRFPRDYSALDREEKSFIVDAALLLHDYKYSLVSLHTNQIPLNKEDEKSFTDLLTYINGIIEDFRLKDIKRRTS
jgi:hypothetical protein